jgi:glycosyltransferase involved in cell wall biosynthesis
LQRFGSGVESASLRSQLGFKSDDVILLFIGWLYDHVGVDTVMRTLPRLPANVKLLVVGAGEGEPQLRALHQELNLGERVVFAGSRPYDSMPRFMAMADVCLLYFDLKPITQHIVPIKIYEYMASGKPVLASPLPAIMRDVSPDNGVLYTPQTELLNELNRLLDSNYRNDLGAKSRKFVEENCDWEKLTDEFEALLKDMAQ